MAGWNVVALCAGIGERMGSLTDSTNKSLLPIAGGVDRESITHMMAVMSGRGSTEQIPAPLIDHFLNALAETDQEIDRVHIVVGHYAYKFRKEIRNWHKLPLRLRLNPLYKVTGAAQSLYVASDVLRRGKCVVLEGDHYVDPELMRLLLSSDYENACLVDMDLSRLKWDEEVVAYGYQGVLEHLQWLPPYPDGALGEALTIFKLGAKAASDLAAVLEQYLLEPGLAKREIVEPMNRLLRMHSVHYVPTGGRKWVEIDYPADLEYAEGLTWN